MLSTMHGRSLTIGILAGSFTVALAVALPAGAAVSNWPGPTATAPNWPGPTATAPNWPGPTAVAPSGQQHGCDPISVTIAGNCLLPFPDDYYASADGASVTGERIAITSAMMPASGSGVHIDPVGWDRGDGFSPGGPILTVLPGVDLTASHVAPITNIGASLDPNAPVELIDTRTGQRIPYWAELDATDPNPATQAILIHPAYRLADQTTYIVVLRNLATSSGQPLPPPAGFASMLSPVPSASQPLRDRWAEMRPLLRYLAFRGIGPQGLDQAWEFTTASTLSLTGQVLHMRDQAFAGLAGHAPPSVITNVSNYTAAQNAMIARVVDGYVEVPSYLNQAGGPPGSTLHYAGTDPGLYAQPEQVPGNTQQAQFECVIPRGAMTAPARNVLLFGHGLLQDQTIVSSPSIELEAARHDEVTCAADWLGLSAQDVPALVGLAQNLSLFGTVPDRMQQAYLDFLFLGRAMIRPDGLAAQQAFRNDSGQPVIAAAPSLGYAGYSLGGIEGGALAALAQDYTRAALYVPGSEFSLLIERSVDFTPFAQILASTYPDRLEVQIGTALMQMLWDRGEPDGYIDHLLRDPLPGTPVKHVLVQEVFGDHQVANIATETEARTLGIPAYTPELQPGRSADVVPFWALPPIPRFPYQGSALFMWDSGSPRPPLTNIPPTAGHDPHDDLAITPASQELGADFLLTGSVTDVCGGAPCVALAGS